MPTAGLIYKNQSGVFFVAPAPTSDSKPVVCNLIGKAAARTKGALVEAIAAALSAISAQEARSFFEHAGNRPMGQLL